MSIQNYQDQTRTYVIDENYQIVFFNDALKNVFPDLKVQDYCYKSFCGEDKPCQHCPLTSTEDRVVYFNKLMKQWITVNTCKVQWPSKGDCYLVMCQKPSPDNQNLFFNLTNLPTYDDLFEFDLTTDTYQSLYHTTNNYNILRQKGCLSTLIDRLEISMVHPEDLLAHYEFWNPISLEERLRACTDGQIIDGLFRIKKADGSWAWTRHIIVPNRQHSSDSLKALCFLVDIHTQREKELSAKPRKRGEKNRLTGLLYTDAFLDKADKFIRDYGDGPLCMLALDIEHFKLFNDWYGWDKGDEYLKSVASHLARMEKNYPCLVGYMSGDNFAAVVPHDIDIIKELMDSIQDYVISHGHEVGFFPLCGYYVIDDRNTSASLMYDRAAIALTKIRGSYYTRINKYESNMVQEMEDELFLLSDIQRGLAEHEFIFYAQPKCHMSTGRIIGAESLVRWKHHSKGLVSPGLFIPVLEKNGFISSLDCYIWEEVCKWQRNWIDRGNKPLPISVNVSQIDIISLDVVEFFNNLIEKYQLPPSLIEIEITESAYAKKYDHVNDIVEQLHNSGFQVLMDDFGSGYSSLNMLRNLNVDILKVDMKFLDIEENNTEKGYGILESIVNMARQMNMPIIVEGVETDKQIKYLQDMGCRYAQGYFFYKPMPVEDYEALLSDKNNISTRGIYAKRVEQLHTREFLDINLFSDTMFNNLLGPAAFYEMYRGEFSILRVNEQYFQLTQIDDLENRDYKHTMENIHPEDCPRVYDTFLEAQKNQVTGSKCQLRYFKPDGSMIWIELHSFFLREQDEHLYYYGSLRDITQYMVK